MVLLQLHRFIDLPSQRRAVWLGLALWVTALGCGYYGIFAVLIVTLGLFWFGVSRRLALCREFWWGTATAVSVSVVLTLPFFLPYLETVERGFGRTLGDAAMHSANLQAFAASTAWTHRQWLPYLDGYNEVLFPGVLASVLGLVAVCTLPRRWWRGGGTDIGGFYVAIAVLGFWLALGPAAGLYRLAYELTPGFGFLRAPARMGVLVTLALCVLSAGVIQDLVERSRRRAAAIAGLALVAVIDLAGIPLTQFRTAPPLPPAYQMLALLPRGPVSEFPYWYQSAELPRHAQYMLYSTAHWQPLINGYSDFIPLRFSETMRQLASFPSNDSLWILSELDTRYVALHLDLYGPHEIAGLIKRLEEYTDRLRPLVRGESVLLFELVP